MSSCFQRNQKQRQGRTDSFHRSGRTFHSAEKRPLAYLAIDSRDFVLPAERPRHRPGAAFVLQTARTPFGNSLIPSSTGSLYVDLIDVDLAGGRISRHCAAGRLLIDSAMAGIRRNVRGAVASRLARVVTRAQTQRTAA